MRLVLDTTVLVAAIRSNRGASNRLVDAALAHRFRLVASVPLFLEYEAVLTRHEHLEASGLSVGEIGILLDALASVVEPVRLSFCGGLSCAILMTTWCWKQRLTGAPLRS